MLSPRQQLLKRALDLGLALPGFLITAPVTAAAVVAATIDTRQWGIFSQLRIGRHGKSFRIYKIRTMRKVAGLSTTVTSANDLRLTRLGRVLRTSKIDELPQLLNVIIGDMSLVGPRPDVAGFADKLVGDDRIILEVRPGITGPAQLIFRAEEKILASVQDPEGYNHTVLWPAKVQANKDYVSRYSVSKDVQLLRRTLFGGAP